MMFSRRRLQADKQHRANKAKAAGERQQEAMKLHGLKTPFPTKQPEQKTQGAKPNGAKPDGAK